MKLVYDSNKTQVEATHAAVLIGDQVLDSGWRYEVVSIEPPRSPNSTGRVYVDRLDEKGRRSGAVQGYYPHVFGMVWDERPDQKESWMFTCPLCGQHIRDGKPCGCGFRNEKVVK
jgi:hypothetical protein